MITGAHAVLYSKDAEADRAFFRDTLGFPAVDAGGGWLIFALPPTEAALHPTDADPRHELYLMCDDIAAERARLGRAGAEVGEISDEGWGKLAALELPGGGTLGIYQPFHAVPPRD